MDKKTKTTNGFAEDSSLQAKKNQNKTQKDHKYNHNK